MTKKSSSTPQPEPSAHGELVLYATDDGKAQFFLRAECGTVWLTQLELASLFQTSKQNVSLHIRNILSDGELREDSVVKENLTTAADGKRYRTQLYNLDLILAVGYRVRSPRGVQFRQWATTHLKEYLIKGFVIDDARLKQPEAWDYFDELLERIRDIRASENASIRRSGICSRSRSTIGTTWMHRRSSLQKFRTKSCLQSSKKPPLKLL